MNLHSLTLEILDVVKDCMESDWDGPGSDPVTMDSIIDAVKFAKTIPDYFPNPEIGVHPDGCIDFDWWTARRKTLSIAIGKDSCVHYAWLDGEFKDHGKEADLVFPAGLIIVLENILNH